MICYWDSWNRRHATRHGISELECTYVLRTAKRPYPQEIGGGKYVVRGTAADGRYVQIIFVYKVAAEIKVEEMSLEELVQLESSSGPYAYVIHARELERGEKRRYRRRRRRM